MSYTLEDAQEDIKPVLARVLELRETDPDRDNPEMEENWDGLVNALERFLALEKYP